MKNITILGFLAAFALLSTSTYIIMNNKSHQTVLPPVNEPGNLVVNLDNCSQISEKNDLDRTIYYLRNLCSESQSYDIIYQLDDGSVDHQNLTCLPKNALAALSISKVSNLQSFSVQKC